MAHITNAERSEIAILLKKKYSHHDIADALHREQSTISREIERNSVNGEYNPRKAKVKARIRRMQSKYQGMKVRARPKLQSLIIEKLQEFWTPEEIAGHLKYEQIELPYVSAKGIYKWLYSAHGQVYCFLLPKRRFSPKKQQATKGKRVMIPNRTGIEKRPQEANERLEIGHGEGDTMLSGKRHDTTEALAVLHDRKARYTHLKKIPNLKPSTMASALRKMGKNIALKTLTLDNGIENKNHESVAVSLNIRTFFCNPYHSWEKGSVENTIGRIRRFIPKGANLADYTDEDIAAIEHWLNHTPRKCLNYKTPYDMMKASLLSISSHPSDAFEG
jgi:IS30 family transposase